MPPSTGNFSHSAASKDEQDFNERLSAVILGEVISRAKDEEVRDALLDAVVLDNKLLAIYQDLPDDMRDKIESIMLSITGSRPEQETIATAEGNQITYHIDLASEELLMRITGPIDAMESIASKNALQNEIMQKGVSVFVGDTRVLTDGVLTTGIFGIETISDATRIEIETAAGTLRAASISGEKDMQLNARDHTLYKGEVSVDDKAIAKDSGTGLNLQRTLGTRGFLR